MLYEVITQVGIGEDQLFTGQAAQPGGFQPDVLHAAQVLVDDQEIAHRERFVQRDTQRREQVPEDVLYRQRHGDTTDTEPRHQCGDIDTEVVQNLV